MDLIKVGSMAPNFSLLDNIGNKVARDYGIYIQEEGVSERANIIIDEKGIVKWVKVYPREQLPDINEVIQEISNM